MIPFKAMAHINSLGGQMDEITVLEEKESPRSMFFIVDYKGTKCTAILNPFNGNFYADDLYGNIEEHKL